MGVESLYPAGAFSGGPGGDTNNNPPAQDYAFSGWGDINRSEDDDSSEPWEPSSGGESGATNSESRSANAAAADTVNDIPYFGRAFPQAGAGGVVGDDDMINHVYGES